MPNYLSYSKMMNWLKCRRSYDFKYHQGLTPKPSEISLETWERFTRGILIHGGCEAAFLGDSITSGVAKAKQNVISRGVDAEKLALLDALCLSAVKVASDAMDYFKPADWDPVIFNGNPLVEGQLIVPVSGFDGYQGYVDLVAREKSSGMIFVIDYKTRERFEDFGDDVFNMQFATYQYMLKYHNIDCAGSILFEMKPEVPKSPRTERFRTIKTKRSDEYIQNVWDWVDQIAKTMASERNMYPSMYSFNCKSCPYKTICQGEMQGDDTDYIRKELYINKNATVTMEI